MTSDNASLIEEYRNLVNTGAEYAASELRLAPTSAFEIYIGHFRDIGRDIEAALSTPPHAAGLEALRWCVSVCDHALEHYKGPVARKIRREIAVELARRSALQPSDSPALEAGVAVKTLQFYADKKNWMAGCWSEDPEELVDGIICIDLQQEEGGAIAFADCGDRARKALAALAIPAKEDGK